MSGDDHSHQLELVAAGYNSRILQMLPSSCARCLCCAFLLLSHLAFGADWRRPAAQLAEKISTVTGPGVIAVEITNRSSISSADVEQIRHLLVSELAASGVRVWQPDQAAAVAEVSLSENLQSYVWVVQIQQGSAEPSLAMVSFDRPASSVASQNSPLMVLRATTIISQPEPILDVAVLDGSPRRAFLLSGTGVSVFNFQEGHWVLAQTLPIVHGVPFPRDLRGRILLRKDHLFDVYLPGVACHSSEAGSLTLTCSPSDDPWPLVTADVGLSGFYAPARNFFTGVLAPGIGKQKSGPPFYSAAPVLKGNYVLWVLSGTDSQVHLLDGINQQTASKLRWGSNIAGIRAACRPDWFVLATSQEEQEDSVQAFEFPDREPLAASQRLPINGPVQALWSQQNGESVTAVYPNSETGNYEALQLTLACGQ
jgi:hypothetical protein